MEKIMYWGEAEDKELTAAYGIPRTTLLGWKEKQGNPEDWRAIVLDRLSLFLGIQERATERIKALFRPEELKAIWGCLKSTLIDKDLIKNKEYLSLGFADYCIYEEIEAAQFCDGDTKKLSEVVRAKLDTLSEFDRFALLEYIRSESGAKEIFGERG